MKKKKWVIAVPLAFALVVTMSACGQKEDEKSTEKTETHATQTNETKKTSKETDTEKTTKEDSKESEDVATTTDDEETAADTTTTEDTQATTSSSNKTNTSSNETTTKTGTTGTNTTSTTTTTTTSPASSQTADTTPKGLFVLSGKQAIDYLVKELKLPSSDVTGTDVNGDISSDGDGEYYTIKLASKSNSTNGAYGIYKVYQNGVYVKAQ